MDGDSADGWCLEEVISLGIGVNEQVVRLDVGIETRRRAETEMNRSETELESPTGEQEGQHEVDRAARARLEAELAGVVEKAEAAREKYEEQLRNKSEKYFALEKKLAGHGAEIRALTKEFEDQLDTELVQHKRAEHEIAVARDQFQEQAEDYRVQLGRETDRREDLDARLGKRRKRRAKRSAKERARGSVGGVLVAGVFTLALVVGWFMTGQRLPGDWNLRGLADMAASKLNLDVAVSKFDPVVGEDKNILRAQELLVRLGYDPGPADGVAGRATQSALRAFQADMGLEQTGEIDETVLARLRVQDERNSTR